MLKLLYRNRFMGRGAVTVGILFLLSLCSQASAETLSTAGDLKPGSPIFQYVFSENSRRVMAYLGKVQDNALKIGNCGGNVDLRLQTLVVLAPIDLPSDKLNPTTGQWWIAYDLKRCEEVKRYNLILRAKSDGSAPEVVAYFPGSTLASVQLVRDALPVATAAARSKLAKVDCSEPAVTADMRVDSKPHRIEEDGKVTENVWEETWTFSFCGRQADTTMIFSRSPRDGGTDFHTKIANAPPEAVPASP